MLLDTGLRISELLSIKVKNIDFHENMILVTKTKTREHRYVMMTERTKMLLSQFILSCSIDKYIFINLETRRLLHPDSIQTICKRIKEKLKLDQSITPHKWRHTFATRFIENDGNLFVLQKLLGHHDVSTTQIYTHISMKKVILEYNKIVQNI
jgi:site-specific recombinase XerD